MEHEWLEQTFESLSTGKVANVKVSSDPNDGSFVVFWSDIVRSFPTAKYVKSGTSLVPFRVNNSFEQ
jgi:hypothetical protein